jgi:hypothetical protein
MVVRPPNVSSRDRPLIAKSVETAGGLYKNYGSNTGMRVPSGSVLNVLPSPSAVSNAFSDRTLPNTTENQNGSLVTRQSCQSFWSWGLGRCKSYTTHYRYNMPRATWCIVAQD